MQRFRDLIIRMCGKNSVSSAVLGIIRRFKSLENKNKRTALLRIILYARKFFRTFRKSFIVNRVNDSFHKLREAMAQSWSA